MMKLWYSKPLGDGVMASMLSAEIEEIFLPLFESPGKPVDMAVFTRHESEGRLHCEVIAYFSLLPQKLQKFLMQSLVRNHREQSWVYWLAINKLGLYYSRNKLRPPSSFHRALCEELGGLFVPVTNY